MRIISHRGDSRFYPENTLEAFASAIQKGVDGIETDLRRSADDALILFHDRLAPDGREVGLLTRKELSVQVGYTVPTLDEALSSWDKVWWLLELKTPAALPLAIEKVRPYVASREILMISFLHPLVVACCREVPVEGGLTVHGRPLDVFAAATRARQELPRLNTIVWSFEFMAGELVEQGAAAGWRNVAYDANSIVEHSRCHEWKLDALITDFPERIGRGGPCDLAA